MRGWRQYDFRPGFSDAAFCFAPGIPPLAHIQKPG
jgi:hypothetical protein